MNKIPKRFQLLSHTINVEIAGSDSFDSGLAGQAKYMEHKIILKKGAHNGENMETFWHEVLHFLFRHVGVTKQDGGKLSDDEDVVELMGEMMAQITSTMEY